MLTRKGGYVLVALIAVSVIAVMNRAWTLALAAVPLVVAVAVSLLAVTARGKRVEVDARVARDRHLAGDVTRVDVTVHGEGRPGGLAEVVVDVPPTTTVEAGAAAFLARVPGADGVRTRFDLKLPVRGRYTLGGVIVRERHPFGLFRRVQRVNVPVPFVVLPSWEPLDPFPSASPRDLRFGAFGAGRSGAGQEFFGLRGYLPGDPVDAVNWKQTAKRGRPIVNEREHEAPATLIIVLDARVDANVGAGYHGTLEAGIRAAVSVSERATRDRYRVGVVVLADRITWLHPSAGRRQHENVVEHLLDVAPGGRYGIADAVRSLPPTVLPRGATVALVTPPHVDASLADAVQGLAARGARALVVAVAAETSEAAQGRFGLKGDAGARLLALDRARFLAHVRRSGADVVEWDVREPLAGAFAATSLRAGAGGARR